MSIHQFPGGERIPEESIDHSRDLQDPESVNVASWSSGEIPLVTEPEQFDSNVYRAFVKLNLSDKRLREMPENVLNIENGGLIVALKDFPKIDIKKGSCVTLFYDGTGVRLGGLDSTVVLPMETLIKLINDGQFEYQDDFLHEGKI